MPAKTSFFLKLMISLFGACLAAAMFGFGRHPTHLARLEDRGRGTTSLAASGGLLSGIGFFSRVAWLKNLGSGRPAAFWELQEAHCQVIPFGRDGLAAIPYLGDEIMLFKTGRAEMQQASFRFGDEPMVVSGMIAVPNGWLMAAYEMNGDGTVKKKFPYFLPVQLKYRYQILSLGYLKQGRDNLPTLFAAGAAEWHEESFHPWKMSPDPANRRLFVLNAMSEELLAYDLETGAEIFRRDAPSGPAGLAVSDNDVFIASPESSRVSVYDTRSGRERLGICAGRGVVELAWGENRLFGVSKYRRRIFSARKTGSAWEISEKTLDGVPASLALARDGIYVADAVTGRITKIDPGRLDVLAAWDGPEKL